MTHADSIWQRDIVPARWRPTAKRLNGVPWAMLQMLGVVLWGFAFLQSHDVTSAALTIACGSVLSGRQYDRFRQRDVRHANP